MKRIALLTIIILVGLQGCNVGTTKIKIDESIDYNLKKEINALDEIVYEAFSSKNIEPLKTIMSDPLLKKDNGELNKIADQTSNTFSLTTYKVLNQFHIKNTTSASTNTILSVNNNLNDYIIHCKVSQEELFVSLLTVENGLNEFLVTNIYCKYPNGWKLNILQLGQYKVNGSTAPELYSKAKQKYDQGYFMDAAFFMILSSNVAKPADKFWQFQNEDEMNDFYEKIMTEINSMYKFPFILEKVETKPQILTIFPQETVDGYFPMIEYLTFLDLEDTLQTKAEYENIHAEIVELFRGIDIDKDYMFYKAFSEMPNGRTPVPTYGFVKKLK